MKRLYNLKLFDGFALFYLFFIIIVFHQKKIQGVELFMEKFFGLKKNNTNVSTEIMAGVTTFFAMKNSGSGTFYGKVFRFKEKQYKCIN